MPIKTQKQQQIISMFNQIAPSYDKANRILSFGVDRSWRVKGIKRVFESAPQKSVDIVDIACGTGDMIELWQRLAAQFEREILSLKGVDASEKMLEIARGKFPNVEFIQSLAQNLPLKDESADIISISYGLRNVTERQQALNEFSRVLKNGGLLLILEFTKREKGGILALCRDFYLKRILPKIGALISHDKSAYEYLPNSIDDFLSKDELICELESANFRLVRVESFSFGISSAFIAQKIPKKSGK